MTNRIHEANRKGWDAAAPSWQAGIDSKYPWREMIHEPSLCFETEQLEAIGQVTEKHVCVLGSGDNFCAFTLAGMGAQITSVDISQTQLDIAARRAAELDLDITFIRADVVDLSPLDDASFDMVYTGGHVAIWVSDLDRYYAEAARILNPGGRLIICEYHPFRRLWDDEQLTNHPQYPYFARGPHAYDRAENIEGAVKGSLPSYEFHWTIADYVHAVWRAGLELVDLEEFGDESEDWEAIALQGLPLNLLLVGEKGQDDCSKP